jgi:probable HAF family extracellular repeat protein
MKKIFRRISLKRFTTFLLLALAALATLRFAHAQTYTLTDLGTLPGTDHSYARAINNKGEVVGQTVSGIVYKNNFYWKIGIGMVAIPNLNGSTFGNVSQINDAGEVLGSSSNIAYIWKYGANNNQPMPLPWLANGRYGPSYPWLNNADAALGQRPMLSGQEQINAPIGPDAHGSLYYPYRGVVWEKDGSGNYNVVSELPPLAGDNESAANAVNINGVVIGSSDFVFIDSAGNWTRTVRRLVRWDKVNGAWTPTELPFPTPGWLSISTGSTNNTLINAAGDVLGFYNGGQNRAFYTRGDGSWTSDVGFTGGYPYGFNDRGQAVGDIGGKDAYWDPLRPSGSPLLLGTLGGTTSSSSFDPNNAPTSYTSISATGTIVGWSKTSGDKATHAFVWLPDQATLPVTGGRMYDLNTQTPSKGAFLELTTAVAISSNGQIAGWGQTSVKVKGVQQKHAFLLTPKP